MEVKRLEANLRQEARIRQEAKLWRPEFKTKEEGEGSGTGASEEEEARDKDNEEYGDEDMTTSGEDINGPDEDAEWDNDVFDGDEGFDWGAIRGGGGSEEEEWESGGSGGEKNDDSLEAEETEEA